jgi:multicomponent Na+:H+ antiporter subunit C
VDLLLALTVGVLFGCGIYLLLRRSIVKLLLGVALLGHGANLLIFTVGGLIVGRPPLVRQGETVLAAPYADPLPQALILTAIVIGFGVLAFAIVLVQQTYAAVGTDDLDRMREADV